jgi:hypothetical protein
MHRNLSPAIRGKGGANKKTMSDNKKKIGQPDRNLISFKEKYEVNYAVNQLKKQFPGQTKQKIKEVLFQAAKKVSPSEKREKVMVLARKSLKK